ncbi:hypothetical protein [Kitasatospora sp. NPDC097691]|uniref:hypothetical protein n=1 Tax=Kitasatospora sp. NPDC097691 TaxID=3157231 RepID=UPI003323047C
MAGGEVSVEEVRERLEAGESPGTVCGELAVGRARWWEAALVVGRALGLPEAELARRVSSDPDSAQAELRPGEEEFYGDLLAAIGVFDVPKQLDEREQVVMEHLRAALGAMGGIGGGHYVGLARRLVRGESASAFLTLVRFGPRAGRGRPQEFWAALLAAGDLLDPADGDERGTVAEALVSCRSRLSEFPR